MSRKVASVTHLVLKCQVLALDDAWRHMQRRSAVQTHVAISSNLQALLASLTPDIYLQQTRGRSASFVTCILLPAVAAGRLIQHPNLI